jgi:hypothetical protein
MSAQHTPGPWRWEFNSDGRRLHLVGGKRKYDLTVMDFERWGMGGATMRLRDPAHDGMQLLYRVHERPDWIVTESGREHHKNWHQLLAHPDAKLIEAAPDLLKALQGLETAYCRAGSPLSKAERHEDRMRLIAARAAITKATGQKGDAS